MIKLEEGHSNGGERVGLGSARTHIWAPSLTSYVNVAIDRTPVLCASGFLCLKQRQGSPNPRMEQFCMLIVMVLIQIYTCDKMSQNSTHTHTQKTPAKTGEI